MDFPRNYSLKKVDPNNESITRYGIPRTISLGTKKHHGIFVYTIDAMNMCFHRYFTIKTNYFEKIPPPPTVLDNSLPKTEREYFCFGKTLVELNTENQEITINDYKTDAKFTIVHPDNYWKLPSRIINIS